MDNGPGVHILFGFECSLLLISSMSTFSLHWMHIIDGLVSVLQHFSVKKDDDNDNLESKIDHDTQGGTDYNHKCIDGTLKSEIIRISKKTSNFNYFYQFLIASWLEN